MSVSIARRLEILTLASVAAIAGASACSKSPTSPGGTTTVTTPAPLAPPNGAQIANSAQPVTLSITNAVATGGTGSLTYTFEVATDGGFANKVATKDVPQGDGQTSVKLDPLPAGQNYFWHVRATSGSTTGTFSGALTFSIGPAISISAPALASPSNGLTTSAWPTLTVTNAVHSGPVGTIVYKFELSSNASFSSTLLTATVSEGANQTSYAIPASQAAPTQTTQYFWRVTATDQSSGIASPVSANGTFTFDPPRTPQALLAAQEGLVLWPGIQPTGTNGHTALGDGWAVQTRVSVHGDVFLSPPIEALQLFDLMDRGMTPQQAIDWRVSHGYAAAGAYYSVAGGVIGLDFIYLGFDEASNTWVLIARQE